LLLGTPSLFVGWIPRPLCPCRGVSDLCLALEQSNRIEVMVANPRSISMVLKLGAKVSSELR
jgi:hypothetical protein